MSPEARGREKKWKRRPEAATSGTPSSTTPARSGRTSRPRCSNPRPGASSGSRCTSRDRLAQPGAPREHRQAGRGPRRLRPARLLAEERDRADAREALARLGPQTKRRVPLHLVLAPLLPRPRLPRRAQRVLRADLAPDRVSRVGSDARILAPRAGPLSPLQL